MSFALDTNIFVYAHYEQFDEHRTVRNFLSGLLDKSKHYYMGWQVFYEYIRIVTHPRILKNPLKIEKAYQDLAPYLEDSKCHLLTETDQHRSIIRDLFKTLPSAKSNFTHDCHYAALLKEHAIEEIITCDLDFRKFSFLKVTNPLM